MEVKTYFFDTYAFFELIEGNQNYLPFSDGVAIITTWLNLMELHYGLLRKFNKAIADTYFEDLKPFCVDFDDELIKEANVFRLEHKKKGLSYVDCLGYTIARDRGINFLTGDKEFLDMENVAFVK